jgi:hypothetical protein
MMSIATTIETRDTVQPKEPFHFLAHEMPEFATDHTLGTRNIGCIQWSFPTCDSMMSGSKTNATHNAFGDGLSFATIPRDVSGNAAFETDARERTIAHIMIVIATERTRGSLVWIGTWGCHVSNLVASKTLCGYIAFPVPIWAIADTFATWFDFNFGQRNAQGAAVASLEPVDTGFGISGYFKGNVRTTRIEFGAFLVH